MEVRDYLERININATVDAADSIETLTHLQEQHLFSVPFENLESYFGLVQEPPS